MFADNMQSKKIYKPDAIEEMCDAAMENVEIASKRRYRKPAIYYYNCACAFDIETTSFIDSHNKKSAIMYEWTLGINGLCMIGRTWDEFVNAINTISGKLELDENHRLIIGVHNLCYEFQFFRHYF